LISGRELVYKVYEGEEVGRSPLHFESVEKEHEAKLGDILLGHGWISLWENWFYDGGPFRRLNGESVGEWVDRLDVEAGFNWPSIDEVIESSYEGFWGNVKPFKGKDLFIVYEIIGPTEHAEYSMMPPRPESGFKYDLAYHNLDFAKLLVANRKKAIRLYDILAKYTLELAKFASELEIVDAVRVADDAFAYTGSIYPKWFMENHYLRWHRLFTNAIKHRGKKAILHCDGDVSSMNFVAKLAEIYDGIHPLDVHTKSTPESAIQWARKVANIRRNIGWKAVFHTGISIDLVVNDNVSVEEFVKTVKFYIQQHGMKMLVLSVTHRPYPGRSFSEPLALAKVNAVRKLMGLNEVRL